MRDLRDPQLLGEALLRLRRRYRKRPMSAIYDANKLDMRQGVIPAYESNPSCIDKYGRPDDIEPVFTEVRVK